MWQLLLSLHVSTLFYQCAFYLCVHESGQGGKYRMHRLRLKRRLLIMLKWVHQIKWGVQEVERRCVLLEQSVRKRRVQGRQLLRPQGNKYRMHRLLFGRRLFDVFKRVRQNKLRMFPLHVKQQARRLHVLLQQLLLEWRVPGRQLLRPQGNKHALL